MYINQTVKLESHLHRRSPQIYITQERLPGLAPRIRLNLISTQLRCGIYYLFNVVQCKFKIFILPHYRNTYVETPKNINFYLSTNHNIHYIFVVDIIYFNFDYLLENKNRKLMLITVSIGYCEVSKILSLVSKWIKVMTKFCLRFSLYLYRGWSQIVVGPSEFCNWHICLLSGYKSHLISYCNNSDTHNSEYPRHSTSANSAHLQFNTTLALHVPSFI